MEKLLELLEQDCTMSVDQMASAIGMPLEEAKAAHDALEEVYRPNVDFAGINELTEQEIQRIEGYL